MPSYKTYTVAQYEAFLSQPFSENFGITEKTMAQWFMKQNGAKPVINSYGVTYENLLSTYIPKMKELLNGGYVLFLATTVTEAGGAGNWINHYASDTSTNGLQCMIDDCNYIKNLTKNVPPAMGAPEVNNWEKYVEDKPGETQRVYNNVPNSSIGAYFMPSTMAGNAWVFGENWCLARQPYPVYFGNPYNQIINLIKSTGADPFTSGSKAKENTGNGSPNAEKNDTNGSKLDDKTDKILTTLTNDLEKNLNGLLFNYGKSNIKSNNFIILEKTYNNLYKIKLTKAFRKKYKDLLNTKDLGIEEENTSGTMDNDTDKKTTKPATNESVKSGANKTITDNLYNWANARQGQSFDFDGYYGAQCVDLITQLNSVFNLGLNLSGTYAKDIYQNAVPSTWKKIAGDPSNDANSKNIWNSLPNGCIVWFTNAYAGHVGLKAGDWAIHLGQNVDGTAAIGGPIRKQDLKNWIESGGAGFLGAWVPK